MSNARQFAQLATNPVAFKNKLHNGRFSVDQRKLAVSTAIAVANIAASQGSYVADRWQISTSLSSRVQYLKEATGSVPGTAFAANLFSNSTAAIATSDFARMQQAIEGHDIVDLLFGTGGARPITISFWAHASVAGIYGGVVQNSGASRSYPFTFNLPTANLWTYCTVTIPGCTDGAWDTTEGMGMWLQFCIGAGSQYLGTPGVWSTANYVGAIGQQNILTNGGALRLTKIQLEAGSVATPFEYRPTAIEHQMCRRWYQKRGDPNSNFGMGRYSTAGSILHFPLEQSMRAVPYIYITYDNNDGTLIGKRSTMDTDWIAETTNNGFIITMNGFTGFIDLHSYEVSCEI